MRSPPHLRMSTTALTTLAGVVEPLLPRGWTVGFENGPLDGRRRVRLEITPPRAMEGSISVLPERRVVMAHPHGNWSAGPYKGPSWSSDLRLALANAVRILRDLNAIDDAGEREGAPRLLVLIESPFGIGGFEHSATFEHTPMQDVFERNALYARAAMYDSLMRGEAPLASHLIYTQVLDDTVSEHRKMGIEAGLAWGQQAKLTAVYTDLGISDGMKTGIDRAEREGRPVEHRQLAGRPRMGVVWSPDTSLYHARLLCLHISPSHPFKREP